MCGRCPPHRSRSKHARTRARHGHCSGSTPTSARSSGGPRRVAHPLTGPWRDRRGTRNRRRSVAPGCPSSPRSGASDRCGRRPRSTRWDLRRWRPRAHRVASPTNARPARRSPRPFGRRTRGRKTRCDWPRARSRPPPRPWRSLEPRAPSRRSLLAARPALYRHGRARSLDRQQWRGRTPRSRRDRGSALDRSLIRTRPVRPQTAWTTQARIDLSAQ